MESERLLDINAGKIASIVLTLVGIIGFVSMLMGQLGPSAEDLAALEAERAQWKETMEAQRRYQQAYWEMQPTAAEMEAALGPPEGW